MENSQSKGASLMAQQVKNMPAMLEPQETWIWSLGRKDPLEGEMATYSSILAWKIIWTEESGRLHSKGSKRVGHRWATEHVCMLSPQNLATLLHYPNPFSNNTSCPCYQYRPSWLGSRPLLSSWKNLLTSDGNSTSNSTCWHFFCSERHFCFHHGRWHC